MKEIRGKIITLASILIALIVMLQILILTIIFRPALRVPWVPFLFIVNLCVSLYFGSKWAKWVIVVFLILTGVASVKSLIPPYDNIAYPIGFIFLSY